MITAWATSPPAPSADIEGSTRLLHELGDAYPDALGEHRRVLRDAFERHGGVEVDTQGDAFFVAFARATDALGAAGDAQRALSEGPIRVRIGVTPGSRSSPRRATSASTAPRRSGPGGCGEQSRPKRRGRRSASGRPSATTTWNGLLRAAVKSSSADG
jgi:hypothetical protein